MSCAVFGLFRVCAKERAAWSSFFFSSRRRHTSCYRDWRSDVCSSDLRVDGRTVWSQVAITQSRGRVEQVWLEPAAPEALDEAVAAVRAADLVLLGPGSTYTSVVPNLLVPELGRALAEVSERVVYICNLEPQPGETIGFPPEAHLAALLEHCPGLRVPRVICQRPDDPAEADAQERALAAVGAGVIHADVAAGEAGRHDPARLAAVLKGLT